MTSSRLASDATSATRRAAAAMALSPSAARLSPWGTVARAAAASLVAALSRALGAGSAPVTTARAAFQDASVGRSAPAVASVWIASWYCGCLASLVPRARVRNGRVTRQRARYRSLAVAQAKTAAHRH